MVGRSEGPVAKVVVYLLVRWTFHPGDWRVDGSRPGYPLHCRVAAGNIASNADILWACGRGMDYLTDPNDVCGGG